MAKQFMIEKQFALFEQYCGGALGVCAFHIESNHSLEYHADDLFLMCSTYKLAMAIYLLYKEQQNEINLNDQYTVTEYDLRTGAVFTLNQFAVGVLNYT